ncbi:unnamed protein product [Brugia pahangi]|uniref:Conserved domain protein n=1 Tax=Brugia pahangi TaxID=6280 RepID=A0A0N4TBZ6_BRUPA|nr:unnamed protein product [Brugia pahangi]
MGTEGVWNTYGLNQVKVSDETSVEVILINDVTMSDTRIFS